MNVGVVWVWHPKHLRPMEFADPVSGTPVGGETWWISAMEGDQRKTGTRLLIFRGENRVYGLSPMDGSLLRSDGS